MDEQESGTHNNLENLTTNLLASHDIAFLDEFRLHATSADLSFSLMSYRRQGLTHSWIRRAMGLDDACPCRLRRLHLSNLYLDLEDIASHISSGHCPALEVLELENCNYYLNCNYYHSAEFYTPTKQALNIICALSNVTSLRFSQFLVMLRLYEDCEDLPVYNFKNLRTLSLDECLISDDFLGLQQYLRNSHNLQKLTLFCCKVSNFGPRKELMERRHSYFEDLADFKCDNLRLSEIMYPDGDDDVHLLVKFLEGMRRNLSDNKIQLTKVD